MRLRVPFLRAALIVAFAACGPIVAGDTQFESLDFEANDGAFISSGVFEWGVPSYPAELSAHSGSKLWATNLSGQVEDYPGSFTLKHGFNVPAHPGLILVSWWDWFDSDGNDYRNLVVDDLSTQSTVWSDPANSQLTWQQHTAEISAWAGDFVFLTFDLQACCDGTPIDGWYLDDFSVVGTDFFAWDFESTNGSFQAAEFSDWQWGTPTYPVGLVAHSGTKVWGTNLSGEANEPAAHDLRRRVTLSADPYLAYVGFWDWFGQEASDYRLLYVDDGSLHQIWIEGADQREWVQHRLDLSAWAGQTVDLLFRLDTYGSPPGPDGWYLDDVEVGKSLIFEDGFESGDMSAWTLPTP